MTPVGMGIDRYLLRQVAADRSRLDSFFWNAIRLKLYRGIPVTIASIVLVHALDYGRDTELTVSIMTVGLLFDTMARTMQSVFNAFERSELVAWAIVAQRIVAATLGVALLLAGFGVVLVAIAFALGALVRLLLSLELLRRRLHWPAMVAPEDVRREIRRHSLTFTTQDLFGLVLARADVLLLAALTTDADRGPVRRGVPALRGDDVYRGRSGRRLQRDVRVLGTGHRPFASRRLPALDQALPRVAGADRRRA